MRTRVTACPSTGSGRRPRRRAAGRRARPPGRRSTTTWSTGTSPLPRPPCRLADRHHRAPDRQGKLYACCIKDVFSNRSSVRPLSDRMTATSRSPPCAGHCPAPTQGTVIVHSDRAANSAHGLSGRAQGELTSPARWAGSRRLATTPPWSRSTPCCRRTSSTSGLEDPRGARLEIVYWIEHTYNRRRRQRGLGKLTPVEFELAFAPRIEDAAA